MCKMIIKVDMEINDLWNYLRIVTLGVLVLYMLGSAHIDCFSVLHCCCRGGKEEKGQEREGLREARHLPRETHCTPDKEHAGE